MLKALVFDFDGLIADTETPEFDSWSEEFRAHGVELDLQDWIKCVGSGPEAWDVIDHLQELSGRQVDREAVYKRRSARFQQLAATMTVLPGVLALLGQARQAGVPVAIASSSESEWVGSYLDRFGIADSFQAVLTREQVPAPKPEPYLYIEACKSLGVDPASAVALEDSVSGVTAAKSAGMTCVAVPNDITRSFDFSHADRVLETLDWITLEWLDELVRVSAKARS